MGTTLPASRDSKGAGEDGATKVQPSLDRSAWRDCGSLPGGEFGSKVNACTVSVITCYKRL